MKSQNRSSAVMQQRNEPHNSLDDFPTPPWATRALCSYILGQHPRLSASCLGGQRVWEPACNRGYMARPLAQYFDTVFASDIANYGFGWPQPIDFLFPQSEQILDGMGGVDWIITNPPFRLAEQFVHKALEVATTGVAVFVRSAFVEGKGRYERLFSPYPPAVIAQFAERVPLVRGRVDETASSATAYCWIVWLKKPVGNTSFAWIPPCRDALEQAGDYPGQHPRLPQAEAMLLTGEV